MPAHLLQLAFYRRTGIAARINGRSKLEVLGNTDTQRLDFSPASDPYSKISGEVVWNDERQEGYMSLANLPVNNPTKTNISFGSWTPNATNFP